MNKLLAALTIFTSLQLPAIAQQATAFKDKNAQLVAVRSGNNLIISSIPPGTYTVSNAANPSQSKSYTVTSKACLVSDRTSYGSPSTFLISRQGLTFPVVWNALQEISTIPTCN